MPDPRPTPPLSGSAAKASEIIIEEGKIYRNGRGDMIGPMVKRTSEIFTDQHGALYTGDGREYNHVKGSTANIVTAVPESPPAADIASKIREALEFYAPPQPEEKKG